MSLNNRIRYLSGFSLVEVSLALGVAAFCLLSILGLLQTGLLSDQSTTGRTAAWGLVTSVYSDLKSSPTGASVSPVFGVSFINQSAPQTLFFSKSGKLNGAVGSAPDGSSFFRMTVSLTSDANLNTPTQVRFIVTWPATADPLPNQWPSNASGSVEVVTTLSRN